jgi:hypothetical protein
MSAESRVCSVALARARQPPVKSSAALAASVVKAGATSRNLRRGAHIADRDERRDLSQDPAGARKLAVREVSVHDHERSGRPIPRQPGRANRGLGYSSNPAVYGTRAVGADWLRSMSAWRPRSSRSPRPSLAPGAVSRRGGRQLARVPCQRRSAPTTRGVDRLPRVMPAVRPVVPVVRVDELAGLRRAARRVRSRPPRRQPRPCC